jgi:NhaP-type Na+/H+ or K+/H+ antiporter
LTLLVFLVFGVALMPLALERVTWQAVLYGLLSLTVIRMIPVSLSLIGKGLKRETVLFLGWFGPRGIASLLFMLQIVNEMTLGADEQILVVVTITVLISIFAHGLSAHPAAGRYARRIERYGPEAGEQVPVTEMPVRIRHV